jgi:hypothetical protein
LLFEALVMMLAREMPVKALSKIVKEHDTQDAEIFLKKWYF